MQATVFVLMLILSVGAEAYGQVTSSTVSFENDMEGWESDSLMPQSPCYTTNGYPECTGHPSLLVDRRAAIQRTTEQAYSGTHAVRIFMDNLGGTGLAWVVRPFPATPSVRYRVQLRFYVAPPQGEINADPMLVYAAPSRPLMSPANFNRTFTLLRSQNALLEGDWARYEYINEVVPDDTGVIWVAAGVEGSREGFTNFFFDFVTVNIEPISTSTTTTVLGVAPNSGSGRSQGFTFTFGDAKGWQDLGVVNILINDSLNPSNACYLAYVPAIDVLYLVNDVGTALLPGILLGGENTPPSFLASPVPLSNHQCAISGGDSIVLKASGNALILSLAITFSSSFAGGKTFYLAARDPGDANNTGWKPMGTWLVQ